MPEFTQAYQIAKGVVRAWIVDGIAALPNLIVAVSILILFYFLGKLTRKTVSRLFHRLTNNNESIIRLISGSSQFFIFLGGLFIALGVLNLERTVISLLAGAGVLGLALGFAFKEILSDYISGTMIAVRQPFRIGEIIETNGFMAKVKFLNLRTTVLETFTGQLVHIPNREIFLKPIVNYSRMGKRRVDIHVGVHYNSDLPRVRAVLGEVLKTLSFSIMPEENRVLFTEFAESSILIEVQFWVNYPGPMNYLEARSIAIEKIRTAFAAENIVIPFPIRTLQFEGERGRASVSGFS